MTPFNSPLGRRKADRLISLLDLPANAHVLDVGCGTGEFLIRVVAAHGALGLGIDVDADCIEKARDDARGRVRHGTCAFVESDIREQSLEDGSFDLAICLGAAHAFAAGEAAYPEALRALSRLVAPGGQVLVGEGYWKQPPAAEYLKLLGDTPGIYRGHEENVRLAEDSGLVPLYAAVSNEDEWDHFEWSHRMRIEREALRQPDDPAGRERLRRSREWRNGYLRWGRSTMGFGFYLFARP